tara:strand:- start:585 stop:776 length:192 start_codon:yes stop_codon:yes gene_type:complete
MPEGDITTTDGTTNVEVVWFGNQTAFTIGTRPIKIWELIVGLIVLSMLAPIFYNRGGGGGRRK